MFWDETAVLVTITIIVFIECLLNTIVNTPVVKTHLIPTAEGTEGELVIVFELQDRWDSRALC